MTLTIIYIYGKNGSPVSHSPPSEGCPLGRGGQRHVTGYSQVAAVVPGVGEVPNDFHRSKKFHESRQDLLLRAIPGLLNEKNFKIIFERLDFRNNLCYINTDY